MSREPQKPAVRAQAEALLRGGSPAADVARATGVPLRTVQRWAAAVDASARSRLSEVGRAAQANPQALHLTVVRAQPDGDDEITRLAVAALLERLRTEPEEVSAADLLRVISARSAAAERQEEEPDAEPAEVVEAAIGRGWSLTVRRKLAASLGITAGEVDALHAGAIARSVRGLDAPAPERVAEMLIRIRWAQDLAIRAGDLTAFTRLLSLEMRVQQLDTVRVEVSAPRDTEGRGLAALYPVVELPAPDR